MELGPSGKSTQAYYLPAGVTRGKPFKNRVDYFDSKKWVLQHLASLDADGCAITGHTEDAAGSKGEHDKENNRPENFPRQLKTPVKRKGALEEQTPVKEKAQVVDMAPIEYRVGSLVLSAAVVQAPAAGGKDIEMVDVADATCPAPVTDVPAPSPILVNKVPAAEEPVAHDPRQPSQEMQPHEQLSDAALAAEVMSLKETISLSTPEGEVIAALKRLEALGPLPLDVLRVTMVGKALNALMKQSARDSIRKGARALLTSWKDSVCRSSPDASVDPPMVMPIVGADRLDAQRPNRVVKSKPASPPPILAECLALDVAAAAQRTAAALVPPPRKAKLDRQQGDVEAKQRRIHRSPSESTVTPSEHDDLCSRHWEPRDPSNDFVLELESGERVVLQCDQLDCMIYLLDNVCSTDDFQVARDDQYLEAEFFWEEFCSVACEY